MRDIVLIIKNKVWRLTANAQRGKTAKGSNKDYSDLNSFTKP